MTESRPIVRVSVDGHQQHRSTVGYLMGHVQTVETFKGLPMQVPAVMVETQDGVECVALKTEHTWGKVEHLDREDAREWLRGKTRIVSHY